MDYDVIVIGAGLSGLTAGALLAKRGEHVAVVDRNYTPGGTCGVFKRQDTVFDQGSALLFGFGEKGFNAHRFVFNVLEEPFSVVRHDSMYAMEFMGHRIEFYEDLDRFVEQLGQIWPEDLENFRRFYGDLWTMYHHVMVETPMFETADEMDFRAMVPSVRRHPRSYMKFLRYMNISAERLLRKYFSNPEILQFYDKLTMTYCYTTIAESPAILAAVMFIENHVGGSYYPAGSTLMLPGKLEKAIEEKGGDMLLEQEVEGILFDGDRACGVRLADGRELHSNYVVYSGTVWALYERMIPKDLLRPKELRWAAAFQPTDTSAVLYAKVKKSALTGPVPAELLVSRPDGLDEQELTVYIPSVDDRTICDEDSHVVIAIGTSFARWSEMDDAAYRENKAEMKRRFLQVLEGRHPGFGEAVTYTCVATPRTVERYTGKPDGAGAGPKQMIGQHMLKRLHTRTRFPGLICCGESTVMGTGTPTVTISGVSAANAVLKAEGKERIVYRPDMENYVTILSPPYRMDDGADTLEALASRCQFCETPRCTRRGQDVDVRGIMRRAAVGSYAGAEKLVPAKLDEAEIAQMEADCVCNGWGGPVAIGEVFHRLARVEEQG